MMEDKEREVIIASLNATVQEFFVHLNSSEARDIAQSMLETLRAELVKERNKGKPFNLLTFYAAIILLLDIWNQALGIDRKGWLKGFHELVSIVGQSVVIPSDVPDIKDVPADQQVPV